MGQQQTIWTDAQFQQTIRSAKVKGQNLWWTKLNGVGYYIKVLGRPRVGQVQVMLTQGECTC